MKAIVLTTPGDIGVVDDWPEPHCGPTDVIVNMTAVGLCGSDLAVASGRIPVPEYPWAIGHEGGGTIVAVGSEVTDRVVGQSVVLEPNVCCFRCEACKSGVTSSCAARRVLGIREHGIAAERFAVPAAFTWPVPLGTPPQALACVEAWVVTQAAVRRAGIQPGDSTLVIGAGSQGLLLCVSLAALGVTPDVVEPHEGRRRLASELGARTAGSEEETAGSRYRYVFETSGASSAMRVALDRVSPAGTVVVIGQSTRSTGLTTREVVQRQITIKGSLIYDHPLDFRAAVARLAGEVDLAQVVKATFSPGDVARLLTVTREVPGKAWIDLSDWDA